MTIPRRYWNKLIRYKAFVLTNWPLFPWDWSNQAAEAVFSWESLGTESPRRSNGYFYGKRWMDWQVDWWKNELEKGLLTIAELRSDPDLADYQDEVKSAILGVFGENGWTHSR